MANKEHLARLKQGVSAWNAWRREKHEEAHARSKQRVTTKDQWQKENPDYWPDLTDADLRDVNLSDLDGVNFWATNLSGADLSGATLFKANLMEADLVGTNLAHADLEQAYLTDGDLRRANLSEAQLMEADLLNANLTRVNLTGADLRNADLSEANLSYADLRGADLTRALLVQTKFKKANLTGCRVYGVSTWNLNLVGAQQSDLVITPRGKPRITVDNLEAAQFIYLLLHNEKIREVIDTVTSKAVLILGRFTPKRKAVLNAIREALRQRNYLPILFDFEAPGSRDFTETISILAHMARFTIADLTEPSSLPKELEAIAPTLAVPVQPVLEGDACSYSMFQDYWKYHWVLTVHRYESLDGLIASLEDKVIVPAEAKVRELEKTRKAIAEEMLKQYPV
jgi:uncharacterized protein YjbI with pentapeptide repeats